MTALPRSESFWVLPDQFFAGNYPSDKTEQSNYICNWRETAR